MMMKILIIIYMSENKKMARFISPGKVKELMIKVIRKEMSYDEMAASLENQIMKNTKYSGLFK
jgi:hypothetical protein